MVHYGGKLIHVPIVHSNSHWILGRGGWVALTCNSRAYSDQMKQNLAEVVQSHGSRRLRLPHRR